MFIPIFLQRLIDLCCWGAAPPSRPEGSGVVVADCPQLASGTCPSCGRVPSSCSLPHATNQQCLFPLGRAGASQSDKIIPRSLPAPLCGLCQARWNGSRTKSRVLKDEKNNWPAIYNALIKRSYHRTRLQSVIIRALCGQRLMAVPARAAGPLLNASWAAACGPSCWGQLCGGACKRMELWLHPRSCAALKSAHGKQHPAASPGTVMPFTRGSGQEQPRGSRDGVRTGCSLRLQSAVRLRQLTALCRLFLHPQACALLENID